MRHAASKLMIIRCASLSDRPPRGEFAPSLMGPPSAANLRKKTPTIHFQNSGETATAPYNLGGGVNTLGMSRAFRSAKHPNATLDTVSAPEDDVRDH
jgi:hypothetical protein